MLNELQKPSGYLKKAAMLILSALLLMPFGVNANDKIRIATFEVEGPNESFSNLKDKSNPFRPLIQVGDVRLDVLPAARAMGLFCSGEYDVLFPVIDNTISCKADFLTVFPVETSFVHVGALTSAKNVGLRFGFEYNMDEILRHFNRPVHIAYIETDEQLLRMVVSGRLDAVLLERQSFINLLTKVDTKSVSIEETFFQKLDVQIAVNKSKPELIKSVQQAFSDAAK